MSQRQQILLISFSSPKVSQQQFCLNSSWDFDIGHLAMVCSSETILALYLRHSYTNTETGFFFF